MPLDYEASADRRAEFARSDDYLKLVDYEGNDLFVQVSRTEPLGDFVVPIINAANTLAAGINTGFETFQFMEPARENRIFHWRWYIRAIWNNELAALEGGADTRLRRGAYIGGLVDPASIPPGLAARWQHPAGTDRGGTPGVFPITINGITTNVGGTRGGIVPSYRTPPINPTTEIVEYWDLIAIYGSFPAFDFLNNSPLLLGAAFGGPPSTGFPADFEVVLTGEKYLVESVTESEVTNLRARLPGWDYRRFTVGGIPTVTTRA